MPTHADYGGCNGPFFGSRGCALGLARVQKHGWAGLQAHTAVAGRFPAAPVHVPTADTGKTVLLTIDAPGSEGVRVGVVGDPIRTLANSVPLKGKLTEAPAFWRNPHPSHGEPAKVDLGQYKGGAVELEFAVPPGATVFAYTI